MENKYKILSIDVGIINMGVVYCQINNSFEIEDIECCKCINIKKVCQNEACSIKIHNRSMSSYIEHFILEYENYIKETSIILIEQQPIHGLQVIQELLYSKMINIYNKNVIFISPVSLHKFLGINECSYEERKIKTYEIAKPYIENKIDKYQFRKHDIADALCFVLYFIDKEKNNYTLSSMDKYKYFNENIFSKYKK